MKQLRTDISGNIDKVNKKINPDGCRVGDRV